MTYARIDNGEAVEFPVYEGDIRLRFPNTSFPKPFAPPSGYVAVADTARPGVEWYQTLTEGLPVFSNGEWQRSWLVDEASEEEKARRTAAKAEAMRSERDKRMAQSDWTQLADAPISAGPWAAYRQDLRDVPEQEGFPWEVVWPEEP